MNQIKYLVTVVAILSIIACQKREQSDPTTPPNIIVIMVDDMGFSDIGCYGGEVETPNIDKMASDGLTFSNFYNAARCCPTRAALLTGAYPHNVNMGWMTAADYGIEGYKGDLGSNYGTIAEVLKSANYSTYLSGKWHVTGSSFTDGSSKHNWPLQRGFDKFFGTIDGAGSFWDPASLTYMNRKIDADDYPDFFYTEAITDSACIFIEDHLKSSKNPFFTYVAYTAPHWPLHARKHDIEKYEDRYMAGWDSLRVSRFKRLKESGIISPETDLTPRSGTVPAWNTLTEEEQKKNAHLMAVYAAQIDEVDQGIGKLQQLLNRYGVDDNTVILFLSDNGGCAEYIHWRKFDDYMDVGSRSTFESYKEPWANLSNTPFRLYKSYVHEGGISSPLVVKWGDKLSGRAMTTQLTHVIDIAPTCYALAGIDKYPKEYHKADGASMVDAIIDNEISERVLFWEHEANRAVRKGEWKLVSKAGATAPFEGPWELYNVAEDRTELNNLIDQYPERAASMKEMWNRWAEENHVYPLDGTKWDERIERYKVSE